MDQKERVMSSSAIVDVKVVQVGFSGFSRFARSSALAERHNELCAHRPVLALSAMTVPSARIAHVSLV
jgi:hypothetical protein